ncbi:hypothetical protein PAXRUDRAFT_14938 [Paxillus rubicundulus Ve08.2h10]|uniref:Uncharacterized protein n=1 Tax=Paxillus rubicundulus Ve08.2h10 TaxID=930991 RepID=A0A0D0CH58_9AGAM|nr:hypothetical protein PAXRUDRAFT_14938 [Paxillus rubicundulus Ve08.2h10]
MLLKHGQEVYKVTAKKHYPFRYTLPKTKGQQSADALATDVDNLADYQEMVTKIIKSKLSAVKIFIDMQHIQKLPQAQASSASGDDSEPSSDGNKAKSRSAKADLDSRLAQWHIKLQQKYKNEHNKGVTYVGPLGALHLTPAMVLDWAHALEEGQVTLSMPPNIESFNPVNKAPILHHVRRPSAQSVAPASPAVNVNSLTSVLLIQTLAQSGLLSSAAGVVTPKPCTSTHTVPLVSRQTPTWKKNHDDATSSSQLIPSPSHLTHFLKYTEEHLGVHHVQLHKPALEINGIGPNILFNIEDKFLADLGISAGDVIHLKKGSTVWWNGPDAKQKRSDTATSEAKPPVKKVAYQKKYHNGGGCRFTGPLMQQDDSDTSPASGQYYDLLYFCDAQNQWLPVPHGFRVDEDVDKDPF